MSRVTILCAVIIMTVSAADEPTAEQLQTMKQFRLSIPPVLLDKNGHDKAIKKKERLPDPAVDAEFSTLEREKVVLMNDNHLTVKPRLLDRNGNERFDVKVVDNGKHFDVTFESWKTTELPMKTTPIRTLVNEIKNEAKPPVNEPQLETITDADYMTKVENRPGIVIVDCYKVWCTPCVGMSRIFDTLSEECRNVKFKKIDVELSPVAGNRMGVYEVPKFVIFDHGKIIASRTGSTSASEMRDWIASNTGVHASPLQAVPASQVYVQPEYRPAPRVRRIYR